MGVGTDSYTGKVGKWSFEFAPDDDKLYLYVAHESLVQPLEMFGGTAPEEYEWSISLSVEGM